MGRRPARGVVGVGEGRAGRRGRELVEERPEPCVIDRHVCEERGQALAVGSGKRADRIERGEDEALLIRREVDIQDWDGGFLAGEGECDPGMAVDDVPGPAVHEDLGDPTDRVERTSQRVALVARMDPPVGGVRGEALGLAREDCRPRPIGRVQTALVSRLPGSRTRAARSARLRRGPIPARVSVSGGAVQIGSEPSSGRHSPAGGRFSAFGWEGDSSGRHSPAGGRFSAFSVSCWFMYILQSGWRDRARKARGSGCEAADLASSDELDHGLQRCHFRRRSAIEGAITCTFVDPTNRRGITGSARGRERTRPVALTTRGASPEGASWLQQQETPADHADGVALSHRAGGVRERKRPCRDLDVPFAFGRGRGLASGSHDTPPIGAGNVGRCTPPPRSHTARVGLRRQQDAGAESVPSRRG